MCDVGFNHGSWYEWPFATATERGEIKHREQTKDNANATHGQWFSCRPRKIAPAHPVETKL